MKVYVFLITDGDDRILKYKLFDTREKVDNYIEERFNWEKRTLISRSKDDENYIVVHYQDLQKRNRMEIIEIEEKKIH